MAAVAATEQAQLVANASSADMSHQRCCSFGRWVVQAHVMSWSTEEEELGLSSQALYGSANIYPYAPEHKHRMRQLQHKVVSALSIGFVEISTFTGTWIIPTTKWLVQSLLLL